MYNTDLPNRAELPTSEQLKRSTIIAAISALAILVTIVLPSEYAIDPTRIGRALGLTEMGEIKLQLAAEAAKDGAGKTVADRFMQNASTSTSSSTVMPPAIIQPSQPPTFAGKEPEPLVTKTTPTQTDRSDEISITLKPGQGVEVKLVMAAGAKAKFSWTANGAVVNYDTHGDGNGRSVSYEKGRGVASDEGVLDAAFDGNHGWFWRNRTNSNVTLTLRTNGDYSELKRVI
ncbi:transmembrane anchor protein [uncultured Castellaniella sp.]|uniref:transmembrane anchor protein n=1 Tax=uncultured Castellaniella sp. TaxID=647907 RepID=UPI0026314A13|nr:transmembrane anchor protein [uncultured Castellaniella sp.]